MSRGTSVAVEPLGTVQVEETIVGVGLEGPPVADIVGSALGDALRGGEGLAVGQESARAARAHPALGDTAAGLENRISRVKLKIFRREFLS